MVEVVASDRKGIAVAAEDKHIQILPRECDTGGKGQRAAVDVVCAVCLHKIREPAAAADAGHGGKFLVMQATILNELEVQRQHGEVAAAGAPRGLVGDEFLFGQRVSFDFNCVAHEIISPPA